MARHVPFSLVRRASRPPCFATVSAKAWGNVVMACLLASAGGVGVEHLGGGDGVWGGRFEQRGALEKVGHAVAHLPHQLLHQLRLRRRLVRALGMVVVA